MFGGLGALLVCCLFAYYRMATPASRSRMATISLTCLALCMVAYLIYPTIAGKFWAYHYMPFAYFACLSVGLCLATEAVTGPSGRSSLLKEALATLILVVTITVQLPLSNFVYSTVADLRDAPGLHAPKDGRVDEIAKWLKARLQPGDTVQPLDWTGGSLHAMMLADARLATRYMYDYHFYHHVSEPYIQELRRSFMEQLRAAAPRFLIEVETNKPWVSGPDTTRDFAELRQHINEFYASVFEGNGYRIYERNRNERQSADL